MKNHRLVRILFFLLFFSQLSLNSANAEFTWDYEETSDGFAEYISISMYPDSWSNVDDDPPQVTIYCDNKKIQVYVWVGYANSIGWSGSGQVKFDKASPKKFNFWLQKDFDGIELKDPKNFMRSLVKVRETFSFKIPTVDGYSVVTYKKSNLLEFRPEFARAGCKF
jgi:hypothetical protein